MAVHLRQEQRTMLWTLAMPAHDAASPQPILGDRFAADLLDRVDDQPTLDGTSLGGNTPLICTRAKLIDDAARAFLARHDEAVVLHLGCGLDSRVLRLDPGPSPTRSLRGSRGSRAGSRRCAPPAPASSPRPQT